MAKKKLLALSLGLILLLSSFGLFPFTGDSLVSASPDRLKWSIVDTPSEEGYVVLSPSEINAIAFGSDDETFYAIDIPTWHDDDSDGIVDPNEVGRVYKSTNAGVTWEDDLTDTLSAEGATLPVWDIAVAPHEPKLIAVVTNNRTAVYVSGDGGDNWENTDVPDLGVLLISDIAISKEYDSGGRDIAIGTRNPDSSTNGDIWVIKFRGWSWKAQGLNMDVTSVRFSPDYDNDNAILAVASDENDTYLRLGYRRISDNTTEWEEELVEIVDPTEDHFGDSPNESEIITSDLILPSPGYSEGKKWTAYASYSSTTSANIDDVYRIEDNGDVFRLKVKRDRDVPIASIAYNNGKLLVGGVLADDTDSAEALIRICSNPGACTSKLKWEKPTKPPTGGAVSGSANAQVAWSSDGVLYCGTSTNHVESATDWADMTFGPWSGQQYDESAFSVSKDGGDTWNQLSLIDTQMSKLCDYALSLDYKTLYLASVGSGFDSLWRSESETLGETWQRILCLASKGEDIILEPTPEGSPEEAIFFAMVGTDDARYSFDKGKTWERVWDCPKITDLVVVGNEMFYVLDDNLVSKSWWDEEGDIWEWQRDVDTGLRHGYTIAISGEDLVFVAEDEDGEGEIAYSTDGGAAFELTEAVPKPGEMLVTPDEEFAVNRFIYAASSEGKIYRWTIEGSTSWRKLNPPHRHFCGLAQKGGALYGACADRKGIARTLIPHLTTVTPDDWDSLEAGLEEYDVAFKLGSLKAMSNEAIDLWAIDDHKYDFEVETGCLWIYSDTFALQTPWPTSPALGELTSCDICTCSAEKFFFHWRELPPTEEYELWVALDEKFTAILHKEKNIIPDDLHSPTWCPFPNSPRFVCGEIYYWKVRSCTTTEGEAIHSRWSPPMCFTVRTCSSINNMHTAPILKVPKNGSNDMSQSPGFSWIGFPETTKYEFILAKDAVLMQIVVKEKVPTSAYHYSGELDWGATYFWQVKALEPVPSEPATGVFTIMSEPQPAIPTTPVTPPAPATPFWIWVVIGILAFLTIVVIVLCLVRR